MSKKIAFIFPGQGTQTIGMGQNFYNESSLAKEMFFQTSNKLDIDMTELLFTQNDDLNQTEFAQPAILLISAIAFSLFQNECKDIRPTVSLGHSLGEFGALFSVGAINFLDAMSLVKTRGELMRKACEGKNAGMMVLLGLDDVIVEEICANARKSDKKVWAANYNNDGQIVIAGAKNDLEELGAVFKEAGAKRALLLPMSVASHCPLLQSAQKPLREKMQDLINENFLAPIISNVTAKPYNTKNEALSLLKEQLVKPVLYKQSITPLEVDCFIEFGGSVLKGLNKKLNSAPTYSITDMTSLKEALNFIKGQE